MESNNIKFKAIIKFLIMVDANTKEIRRRMADMYGDSSPKCSTVLTLKVTRKNASASNDCLTLLTN